MVTDVPPDVPAPPPAAPQPDEDPRIAQLVEDNADLARRLDNALHQLANLSIEMDDSGFLDDDEGPEVIFGQPEDYKDDGSTPTILSDGSVVIGDTLFIVG